MIWGNYSTLSVGTLVPVRSLKKPLMNRPFQRGGGLHFGELGLYLEN